MIREKSDSGLWSSSNSNAVLRDFQLLELSEVDWCVYHAKIATRHMCGTSYGSGNRNLNVHSAKNGERKMFQSVEYNTPSLNNTQYMNPKSKQDLVANHQEMVCKFTK